MPTPDPAPRRLPFVLRLCLWAIVGIGVYALLGFLVLPPVLKSVLTKQLSQRLHRETTIRDIHINPFLLTVRVNGLSLKDRSASHPFISFEELFLDLEAASVVKGGPVLKNIRVKAPYLTVVMVNRSYSTGTQTLARQYPDGVAVATDDYSGGLFDPPPDFAKLAEAANCYGDTVREPTEVQRYRIRREPRKPGFPGS